MITHGAALWWLARHAAYAKPPTPAEALVVALITPPAPLPAAPEAIKPLPAPEPIPLEPPPVIPEPVVLDPQPVIPEPVALGPKPVAEPPPPPAKVEKPRKIKKPKAARIKKPVAPAPAAIQEPQPERLPEPEIANAEPEPPKAAPTAPANVAVPAQLLRPAVATEPVFNADYLRNPAPPYPRLSRRLGEQGKVMLRVLVNIAGTAEKIEIQASSGSTRLDQAALQAVTQWRFVPAKKGAEPITEWVVVPIVFSLEG